MDRRHGYEHGVDARRGDGLERVGEGCRAADLVGQAVRGRAVDVADRDDPQLGHPGGDETGVVAAHPSGSDDRQADPRCHPVLR